MRNFLKDARLEPKNFCLVAAFLASVFAFNLTAQDFSALLDGAKADYKAENFQAAAQKIAEAKKLLDAKTISQSGGSYIEVKNWDVVKLKKDEYLGKKVKYYGQFWGVLRETEISVEAESFSFDPSLVDKILSLKEFKSYTFYGTVKEKSYGGPYLHIEAIE